MLNAPEIEESKFIFRAFYYCFIFTLIVISCNASADICEFQSALDEIDETSARNKLQSEGLFSYNLDDDQMTLMRQYIDSIEKWTEGPYFDVHTPRNNPIWDSLKRKVALMTDVPMDGLNWQIRRYQAGHEYPEAVGWHVDGNKRASATDQYLTATLTFEGKGTEIVPESAIDRYEVNPEFRRGDPTNYNQQVLRSGESEPDLIQAQPGQLNVIRQKHTIHRAPPVDGNLRIVAILQQ